MSDLLKSSTESHDQANDIRMNTTTNPEAATMTATEVFHNALGGYRYGGGSYDTKRRLYEDAHWVLTINTKVPDLAHGDMRDVLDSAGFRTWTREGCTYASAARLIREKLAPVVGRPAFTFLSPDSTLAKIALEIRARGGADALRPGEAMEIAAEIMDTKAA